MSSPPEPSPTGLYKVLHPNGSPFHGGTGRTYVVGEKRSVRGALIPCKNGIHVCTLEQLPTWIGPSIYPVVEASEERVNANDKTVLRWVVLGEPYSTWTDRAVRLFACDCVERVLPIFERDHPHDSRPRDAIAVARRFAGGDASASELAAARAAAWAATQAAADDAAWAAADDAAWAAARDSGWDTERAWQAKRLQFYLFGGEQ